MHARRWPLMLLLATAGTLGAARAKAADEDFYAQAVKQYLAADWETLQQNLSQHSKEIPALPREKAADIAYIKQALNECRPSWWNLIKAGKRTAFRPTLWGRTVPTIFDPALPGNLQLQTTGNQVTLLVNWTARDMDSLDRAEHGFTKGDLTNLGIWGILESAGVWATLDPTKLLKATDEEKVQLQRYLDFRGNLTGAYYGTPRARRWASFLSLDAYGDKYTAAPAFIARKPLGAMLMAEIAGHPWRYPSLRVAKNVSNEKRFAAALMTQFERTVLTLPEDRALREAIRDFAAANTVAVFNTAKVTLPNRLTMNLDPTTDAELATKRDEWLADIVANPPPPSLPTATKPKAP